MDQRNCVKLDYKPGISFEKFIELAQNLYSAFEEKARFFQNPIIFCFAFNTIFDLIGYCYARQTGISWINIRSARFKNFCFLSDNISDPDDKMIARFDQTVKEWNQDRELVLGSETMYEGVAGAGSESIKLFRGKTKKHDLFLVDQESRKRNLTWKTSKLSSIEAKLRTLIFDKFFLKYKPLHAYDNKICFCYFLQAEPEVSLSVYGWPNMNQLEIIKQIVAVLPSGYILLVKEHPWMIGKRKFGFYTAIRSLSSQVELVDHHLDVGLIIQRSIGVFNITGSVGLSSLRLGKPVFLFGKSIISLCKSPIVWTSEIRAFINYCSEETTRNSLGASCIRHAKRIEKLITVVGFRFDLYTGFLRREGLRSGSKIDEHDLGRELLKQICRFKDG